MPERRPDPSATATRRLRRWWLLPCIPLLVLVWLLSRSDRPAGEPAVSAPDGDGITLCDGVTRQPGSRCVVGSALPDVELDTRLERVPPGASLVIASKNGHPPRYPAAAAREGVQGQVMIEVIIDADARIEHVGVARSSGDPRLDKAALDAARRWTYQPAQHAGQSIRSRAMIPVVFTLQ